MSDAPSPEVAAEVEAIAIANESAVDAGNHIIGISFDKVTRAEEVLLALVHLQQEGEIVMDDVVVVTKSSQGRVQIHQTIDPTPARSAVSGSLVGMLVGMLFAPPVFFAAAAAGAGGAALWARLVDLGLDDKWLKQVGAWLDPGTSAIVMLVSDEVRPAVLRELGRFEGEVLYCTFPDAVRDALVDALGSES